MGDSRTRVYDFLGPADLALHLTAPVERTVTSFDHHDLLRYGPSAATHDGTTIDTERGFVALSAVGAGDSQLGVLLAEARGHLVVHQVLGTGGFVFRVQGFELEAVLVLAPVLPLGVYAVGEDAVQLAVLGRPVGVRLVVVVMEAGVR